MRRDIAHRILWATVGAVFARGTASTALAAGPLTSQGSAIGTSSYAVDLFQGPVLAGSRITALAGAYAPLAEGAEGMNFNAAAPAVRDAYSYDRTDYDFTGGVTFPSSLDGTDFDNNGTKGFAYDNFVFLTGGAELQYGPWGLGVTLNLQQYDLDKSSGRSLAIPNVRLRLLTGHVLTGYAFLDDQLVLGLGVRGALLGVLDTNGTTFGNEKELLSMVGVGPELGLVWSPRALPLRFGMTTRAPVRGAADPSSRVHPDAAGDTKVGSLYLPERIELPAELETGLAVQLGPRPLNMGWTGVARVPRQELDPERRVVHGKIESDATVARRILRRRYRAVPRSKVLLLASVLVSGKAREAVGFESFLSQNVDRSGTSVTASPRVAVESEVVPSWLQVRGGSYLEPSRFVEGTSRLHGTAGFQVKVLRWTAFGLFDDEETWFRVGAAADIARGYFGWGLSAGLWR